MSTITCPSCRTELGESVNYDGLVMLRSGGLLIRDAQAICIQCGRVVYWSVSNAALSKLVRSRIKK